MSPNAPNKDEDCMPELERLAPPADRVCGSKLRGPQRAVHLEQMVYVAPVRLGVEDPPVVRPLVDPTGVRLAGHVTVEAGAFVGIGATVVQNVRIGREAVVGAGSVIIRDVPAQTTVAGVPARIIRPAPTLTPRELVEMVAPAHLREVRRGPADQPAN